MRERFHLNNAAIFAVMWVALSGLVLHDISLRHPGSGVGTSVSDRVVTKEFMLVDDNGVTRARIGMMDKTNAPSVQLFDAAGAQRAQLRLNKDDVPSLRLYNGEGNLKSVVGFTLNDMQPTFVTFDANGVGHMENRTRPEAAYINIQDEDLCNGRYVQSYHGTVDLYSGQTIHVQRLGDDRLRIQTSGNDTFYYAQQANAAAMRVEAEAARQQELQQMELARQQEALAHQRAADDAINAAADKVDIRVETSPLTR